MEQHQQLLVTLLGEQGRRERAAVRDLLGHSLILEMRGAVAPGTALQLDTGDSLLLGEAIYCSGSGEFYLVGVELDQVVCGLRALSQRLQEFGIPCGSPTPVRRRREDTAS